MNHENAIGLIGKRCYPKFSGWETFWSRKIHAVREMDKYWKDGTKIQLLVRGVFFKTWVDLTETRVIHWRSPE